MRLPGIYREREGKKPSFGASRGQELRWPFPAMNRPAVGQIDSEEEHPGQEIAHSREIS
jgi:hypothetical protein